MPNLLKTRVGSTGFGLMGLTWRPIQTADAQAFDTLKQALDLGANLWNGAEFYGTVSSNSLHLMAKYFERYPEDSNKVILSIKGGANVQTLEPTGDAAGLRRSIEECLTVLDGKKKLDLFGTARVDPAVPIEATMRTIKEYIDKGQIGSATLSECNASSIRRAAKVTPIATVEVEFSLFCPEILYNGVLQACVELGIVIMAYSPLGKGVLTGQIKSPKDVPADDYRHMMPRFEEANFHHNLSLVEDVKRIASRKECSMAQVALAWIRYQSGRNGNPIIIPIPGAVMPERVIENTQDIILSDEEFAELNACVKKADIKGGRTFSGWAPLLFGDSPAE